VRPLRKSKKAQATIYLIRVGIMAMETEARAMATITLVVPAAGCGARAGLNVNKILAPLCSKPLLWHTLRALLHPESLPQNASSCELIIASKPEEWPLVQSVVNALNVSAEYSNPLIRLVEGGATRQDSVHAAVNVARGDYVLVHDAARPLLSPDVMRRTVEAATQNGAAIAALPVPDTVKRVSGHNISETLPREEIWLAQTPQVFRRAILAEALEWAKGEGFAGTDCSSLVEHLRQTKRVLACGEEVPSVAIVHGDAQNFKVTYAADLERAAQILNREELT
jgi:2-C-methyl-D-erythritol 4-phosphate cytidylyltransferase